jgi:hypothetical protein
MAEEVTKTKEKGPKNDGLANDLPINTRPQGMSDEEAEKFLAMDIRSEFNEITVELEKFHGIFTQLWEMGYPRMTWDLPTAAVAFDKEGRNVDFLWNPLFWQKIDKYTKSFVICHEVLHVMLSHGLRTRDCPLPELANKALDVVVNHMLVSKFGFDRQSIDIGTYPEGHEKAGEKIEMCWIDTVFPGMDKLIERDKPFEYYYRMLEQNSRILPSGKIQVRKGGQKGGGGQGGGGGGDGEGEWQDVTGETLDGHENLEDFEEDRAKDEIADTLDNQLDDDEKRDLSEKIHQSEDGNAAQKAEENEAERKEKDGEADKDGGRRGGKKAGSIAGRLVYKVNLHQKVKKKRKWETVIKKWSRKYKEKDKDEEQWTRRARRYTMISPSLMLPTDAEVEDKSETRIKVRFYQDTSGSCYGFRDRFFAAAKSLPPDRFDVELFCFDTQVYETSLEEGKLYGFGGTLFSILETHIQSQLRSGELTRHPEAVFVITDGYGDNIRPAMPDKWYWFLSDNYRSCIPDTCNIFPLSEYE